jgi:UDP-GlcNAc:undecaprenyl-phosphate GlcNAc-1-phosphate transferase
MQNYFFLFLILSILSITLSIFISKNSYKISSILQLYKRNKDTKKNINRTPLTGGIMLYISFLISLHFLIIYEKNYIIDNLYWIFGISFIFLIGILDDKYQIKYYLRLFGIFITLIFVFQFSDSLLIKNLYFETLDRSFSIGNFSLFLTPFFILLLINSLNMSDGINGNCGIICLTYFLLLFNTENNLNFFLFFLLPALLVFLNYNLRNKIYLGDSGVYFISTFIALYTLSSYQQINSNLSCEKIFLVFMIPGLDMLRLFLSRIINKKNPFFGDLNHFHHLLIKKFTLKISLFIYMTIIIWPHLLRNFLDVKILIILNTLMYTLCVLFLKKLKKFS